MNGFKLKRHISAIITGMLTLFVAPGCVEVYNDIAPDGNGKGKNDFTVDVIAHDFDSLDPKTRAVQNGPVTEFENGDALGLTFLDSQGNIVAGNDNLKFTFDKVTGNWTTSGNPEYDKATSYIAYFPYSTACNGCKTESMILTKFPVSSDQSTKAKYIATDVLFAEGESSKNIEIKFKHSRACISFKANVIVYGRFDVDITEASEIRIVKDINKNEFINSLYHAEDGTCRAIIEPGSHFLCGILTLDNQTSGAIMLKNSGDFNYEKGKRYHSIFNKDDGFMPLSMVKEGDYVAKDGDKLVVVPKGNVSEDYIVNNSSYFFGKVAHIDIGKKTITSVGFKIPAGFYDAKLGYYVYSGTYYLGPDTWSDLANAIPHHQKVYSKVAENQWGPYNISVYDGRSGNDLTTLLIDNINKYTNYRDDTGILEKLNEAKTAFNNFTNVKYVYYAGDREVNYPYVGGYACVSAGEVGTAYKYPLVVRAGGSGSLHLESYGKDQNMEMKVLVDFKME